MKKAFSGLTRDMVSGLLVAARYHREQEAAFSLQAKEDQERYERTNTESNLRSWEASSNSCACHSDYAAEFERQAEKAKAADIKLLIAPLGYTMIEGEDGAFVLKPEQNEQGLMALAETHISKADIEAAHLNLGSKKYAEVAAFLEGLFKRPVLLQAVMSQRPTAFECISEDHREVYLSYTREGDVGRAIALYSEEKPFSAE
jgi:hypothetical protein